jgi:hypothetical protein
MKIEFAGEQVESEGVEWELKQSKYDRELNCIQWELAVILKLDSLKAKIEVFDTQSAAELRLLEILKQIHGEGKR